MQLQLLARGGQGAEVGEQHAGQSYVLVAFTHQPLVLQHLLHMVDVGAAIDEPPFTIADHVGGLILIRQFADNRLQQVVGGDQPLEHAELVSHQNEAPFRLAQLRQQLNHVDGLRHDNGVVLLGQRA